MGKMAVHDEVLELLPWFVNNSLADKERVRIMAHLIECSACRSERDQLQHVQDLVARDDFDMPDYRFSFQKLMNRINASERDRRDSEEVLPSYRSRYPSWPVLATAASLVLAIFFFAGIDRTGISQDIINPKAVETATMGRTLTLERHKPATGISATGIPATGIPVTGISHRVELVFEQTIETQMKRDVFIQTGSYIVDGPDIDGRYLVDVKVPDDMTDTQFIQSIRDMGGVKYAAFSWEDTHLPR